MDPLASGQVDSLPVPSRSFGGCSTCRIRHVRCDQAKPYCSNCLSVGRKCHGYLKRIFFEGNESSDGTARYRQTLFTDDERERMTEATTSELPFSRANDVLAEIDSHCDAAAEQLGSVVNIRRGPFSVFSCHPSTATIPSDIAHWNENSIEEAISSLANGDVPDEFQDFIVPDLFEDFDKTFDSSLSPKTMKPQSYLSLSQDFSASNPPEHSFHSNLDAQNHVFCNPISTGTHPLEAPLLLKHYVNHVIPSMTPFRHTKTPWHILFLPSAMMAMTAMTMGEMVDDAILTNFHGILAISSSDLHHRSSDEKWKDQASMFKHGAQQSGDSVISHALDRPKSFKYKSIIMALVTMAQLSLLDGSAEETCFYLLEAEKVIRLRGLVKRNKSRKVRLLHHVYVYLRILNESLSIGSFDSNNQKAIMSYLERRSNTAPMEDPTAFRLIPWDDHLDRKFQMTKCREQGENDLHLSVPGFWSSTLYPEIFGVSETWLVLLSQVIRLSNEKGLTDEIGCKGAALSVKEFMKSAKALETFILRFDNTNILLTSNAFDVIGIDTDWIALGAMSSALRYALAIYFYRQIYDMAPDILQHLVEKVKDSLDTCVLSDDNTRRSLQGLLWSAFVAGCEALGSQLQASYIAWFDSDMANSHGALCRRLRKTMQQTWFRRQQDES